MKSKIKKVQIAFSLFLLLGVLSCQKDNYQAPTSTFKGRILDEATNELVPQQTINGGILRLFQTDITENSEAITSYFKSDGTFENSFLFDGNYKVVADGPFFLDDTLRININHVKEQDIIVRPYLYVKAEVISQTETSAKVKVNVSFGPGNTTQKIARVGVVAGLTSSLDVNFYSERELTNTESISDNTVLDTDYIFELKNLKPSSTYYIRGASRTVNSGSYYNYAPMLTITTK